MLDLLRTITLEDTSDNTPFAQEDFINKIFPNGIWDFVIQIIAFVILIVIVFFIGYKPLKRMLSKRADYVEGQIRDAETDAATAREAALKKDETIEEGKTQANAIIAEAKTQAEAEANKIKEEAKAAADAKLKRAEEEIEASKAQALEEAKSEMVDLALQASTKLLGREVTSDDNARLVDEFIDSLEDKKQ